MSPEEQRLPDSPAEAPTTALSIKLDGMPTAEESFKEIGGGGGGGGGGQAQLQQQGLSGSFSVQKMRVRSAGSSRRGGGAGVTTPSCGSTRASRPTSAASGPLRPGSPAHSMTTTQDELTHLNPAYMPPAGKGQLAMSVFVTGDGDMQRPDPQRYAFQPRRPAGLMTPGEQQLVRQRPMTAHGRLTGRSSSSAALLLTAPTGGR